MKTHRAHLIALGDAGYTTFDKARCVYRHWDAVAKVLADDGPSAVTLWLSRYEYENFT